MKGTESNPLFFESPALFRAWLAEHHAGETELWVGFYKKGTGRPSLTWPESVDEALCFGWIDGIRKRLDDEAYVIRFTPRKPNSKWSAVNLANMKRLLEEDRVEKAGLEAWESRNRKESGYSYEQHRAARLSTDFQRRFEAETAAWDYFQRQAPWYRRAAIHWVTSAKKEETRERRLGLLIEHSGAGEAIPPLRRPS